MVPWFQSHPLYAECCHQQMSVEKFAGGGDLRAATLLEELEKVVYSRGNGIPIPTIIGVLELLKFNLIVDSIDDNQG